MYKCGDSSAWNDEDADAPPSPYQVIHSPYFCMSSSYFFATRNLKL